MSRLTISGTGEANPDVTIREVLNKLKKYEDLEEQGRLLELPVQPGTIVYKIVSGCVSEADLCDGKCVNCNDYQEYILEPVMSIGDIEVS